MSNKTLDELQAWVNSGLFRSIVITGHCHGVRVTLQKDHRGIVSTTERDILTGGARALEYEPKRIAEEERKDAQERLAKAYRDVETAKANLAHVESVFKSRK